MFRVQYKERYPTEGGIEILSEWVECDTLYEAKREAKALERFDFVYGIEIVICPDTQMPPICAYQGALGWHY